VSKNILLASLAGIAALVIVVAIVLHAQRGAHIELTGKILKVRTAPIDENSSVAAVDFRVTDAADYSFMVKSVTLSIVDANGKEIEGQTVSEPDAKRIFDALPLLGPKYNSSLIIGEKIPPRQTIDRMTSARFEVPDSVLEARRNLMMRIDEVDGRATAVIVVK
jgi:hypothetical protein